jgi:hypothetical protein
MHPRATVDRALRLSNQGLIDREVALITGVSIGAVQKWRTGLRRTPEKELKHANCPRCDNAPLDQRAYAYLFMPRYPSEWKSPRAKSPGYRSTMTCCHSASSI